MIFIRLLRKINLLSFDRCSCLLMREVYTVQLTSQETGDCLWCKYCRRNDILR